MNAQAENDRLVPNVGTKLLRGFEKYQSWVLEEGDMLYLPPRLPHQGVSLSDDCITVSMGFRAPNYRSLITSLCEQVCNQLSEDDFYQDVGQEVDGSLNARCKIDAQVVDRIKVKIDEKVQCCAISFYMHNESYLD